VHLGEHPGGASEHAVHETNRGCRPGQRFQQRHHPVRGQEVHHHQIHREGLQVRAVPNRAGPGALGPGRGVHRPAAALHLVLVVLNDPHADLWDLVLLVAVDHPQIPGAGQIVPAPVGARGEPVQQIIGSLGPPQMRTWRPGLLALGPRRPAPAALLLRRRGLARVVVFRRRARGVPRVTRQQMLHAGQLGGQGLVGLHQLRELPSLRGDLPILRGELPSLTPHDNDQLVARHLLRHRHPKIKAHTSRSHRDRHAHITKRYTNRHAAHRAQGG